MRTLKTCIFIAAIVLPFALPLRASTAPAYNDDANLYNGYWWDNVWVPGFVTTRAWFRAAPELYTGSAVFYAPGVMEATAEYRGLSLDGYAGGVAAMNCADIGSLVWLQRPGREWEGPFLVVDCPQRDDQYGIIVGREEAIEVDFKTARRWGMAALDRNAENGRWRAIRWRLDGVIVSRVPPMIVEDGEAPVVLKDWYLDDVTFDTAVRHCPAYLYRPMSTWRVCGQWITFRPDGRYVME